MAISINRQFLDPEHYMSINEILNDLPSLIESYKNTYNSYKSCLDRLNDRYAKFDERFPDVPRDTNYWIRQLEPSVEYSRKWYVNNRDALIRKLNYSKSCKNTLEELYSVQNEIVSKYDHIQDRLDLSINSRVNAIKNNLSRNFSQFSIGYKGNFSSERTMHQREIYDNIQDIYNRLSALLQDIQNRNVFIKTLLMTKTSRWKSQIDNAISSIENCINSYPII